MWLLWHGDATAQEQSSRPHPLHSEAGDRTVEKTGNRGLNLPSNNALSADGFQWFLSWSSGVAARCSLTNGHHRMRDSWGIFSTPTRSSRASTDDVDAGTRVVVPCCCCCWFSVCPSRVSQTTASVAQTIRRPEWRLQHRLPC